jgi:hypothetical protein
MYQPTVSTVAGRSFFVNQFDISGKVREKHSIRPECTSIRVLFILVQGGKNII